MDYEVKRGDLTVALVTPEGKQNKKVMADNLVNATCNVMQTIDLQINDYIDVFKEDKIERYFLLDTADIKKSSTIEFDYTITFKGWQYKLGDTAYMFPDADNKYTLPGQPMMGNLDTFLDLLIINANREQTGWVKGAVDVSDYRLITFNEKENCLSALSTLAVEYKLEWWVDGQTIHMTKKGVSEDLTFEYGMGKGLYDITRTGSKDKQLFTRLYAYGSDKNIPANYKGFSDKLKLPGITPYLEMNVWKDPADHSKGLKIGVIENTEIFDDIYPHRTGTVSAVGPDIYSFTDGAIDFDVNLQLLGEGNNAKVTFNTGQLGGYNFEINKFDNATKKFTISKNETDKAFILPIDLIKPAVGDQYVITNIAMPASYITAAENELQQAAQAFLEENATPIVSYVVTCDPLYFAAKNITLTLGNYVRVIDTDFGLDKYIRIIAYTRDLQDPNTYTMELAEVVTIASIIKSYQKYDAINNAVNINKLTDVNRARMNWKTTQELRNMVYDPDGYFDGTKIRPNSIETLMLSVGAKAQQFVLEGVLLEANYLGDAAKFAYTGGRLTHFTLFDEPHVFNIGGGYQEGLDPAKFFYIYARCPKDNTNGSIYLSETPVATEQFDGAYFFWIGGLSSVVDGVRGISLTYGSSTVNGRFITTGVIQSADGHTYFDLDAGIIGGKVAFIAGSSGYENLTDKPDLSGIDTALGDANTAHNEAVAAQATANAANSLANIAALSAVESERVLAYMSNDNVLTPQEKPAIVKEWVAIQGEKSIIDTQADAYAISRVSYDDYYSQLNGYLSTYVLNDLTVDSFVSGDTFRAYFGNYYNAKVTLLKAISDKAKVLADTAQTAANVASAGATAAQATANAASTAAGNAQSSADASNQVLAYIANDNVLTPQEKPTVLQDWQLIVSEKPIINAQADNYALDRTQYNNYYTQLSDYLATYVLNDMNADSFVSGDTFRLYFQHYYDAKVSLLKLISDKAKQIADLAITNAFNAATTANAVQAITSYLFTTIDGNLVATGTLLVGDASHNNAGITGVTDHDAASVRIWAGATYANRNTAPFRVTDAGAMFAAAGKIANFNIVTGGLFNDSGSDAFVQQSKVNSVSGAIIQSAKIGTGFPIENVNNIYVGEFINREAVLFDPVSGAPRINAGIYAEASGGSYNYAGIFKGGVNLIGPIFTGSLDGSVTAQGITGEFVTTDGPTRYTVTFVNGVFVSIVDMG